MIPLRSLLIRRLFGVWRAEAARRPAIREALDAFRDAAPSPAAPDSTLTLSE